MILFETDINKFLETIEAHILINIVILYIFFVTLSLL